MNLPRRSFNGWTLGDVRRARGDVSGRGARVRAANLQPFRWVLVLALIGLAPLAPAGSESFYQGPGTRKMAQRLKEIADKADPMENQFLSPQRAELFRLQAAKASNPTDKVSAFSRMAVEVLNAGRTLEAMEEFNHLEKLLTDSGLLEVNKRLLRMMQAVAWLRLAEQENCLTNHTIESCLFPISGGGVHKLERGSRGAINVLTNMLAEFPGDLSARWLLNIASMTLGEYPAKVSAPWLIPPETFASDYDIKRFVDVSSGVGLDLDGLAGGVILDDFDGDGFLDLVNSSWGNHDQIRFFRNNGDGSFTERTKEAGLMGEIGGLNILQADYNNDGHLDFLILRGGWYESQGKIPNSLMRNNGDGTFEDVTEEAGLLSFHPTQTAVWFDYNGDGRLDLFIGNESNSRLTHPCELYRNNGNGTFTECAAKARLAFVGFVKGVTSGDYNNDGRPDLYLSCQGRGNVLYRNDGPRSDPNDPAVEWRFSDVSRIARVVDPAGSFPTWFWDYDNDGWLDLFVAGYYVTEVGEIAADYLGLPHNGERVRLYRNNHNGTFTDVTQRTRLYRVLHAMGSNFGDLDNDGYLDFYIGTGNPDLTMLIPNRMFRNAQGHYFQDVTTSGGFGHLQKGHAVAFGDIDNDGDQDIYEDMGGAFTGDTYRNVLFENPGHGNHWITLKLEGVTSNRSAFGARIKIVTAEGTAERSIYKTTGSGGSFGASPLRQEIGLGQATAIKSIEIRWPASGRTQTFKDVGMDQFYTVREDASELVPWKVGRFKLPAPAKHAHHHHHH